jgi:hypothetical protein
MLHINLARIPFQVTHFFVPNTALPLHSSRYTSMHSRDPISLRNSRHCFGQARELHLIIPHITVRRYLSPSLATCCTLCTARPDSSSIIARSNCTNVPRQCFPGANDTNARYARTHGLSGSRSCALSFADTSSNCFSGRPKAAKSGSWNVIQCYTAYLAGRCWACPERRLVRLPSLLGAPCWWRLGLFHVVVMLCDDVSSRRKTRSLR